MILSYHAVPTEEEMFFISRPLPRLFFSLLKSLAEFRVRRRESDMIRFLPRPARGRKHFARSERRIVR